jgi:two-component system CheB/CheR fusion protein
MKPKDRKKRRSGETHPSRKRSTSQSVPPAGKTDKPEKLARLKIRPSTSGTTIPVPIVGIGASAGGLEAFTQLLKHLPLNTGMGFVLVQHLDPDHESALTQILSRATALPVREITDDQPVEANHVYIIPRDTNLSIVQGRLKLEPRTRTRTPHRPIDRYFESLAQDQHERAIGIVLSGTANDGTLGLEAIKAEGGITFAQDDSAKYDSMPRSAVATGCVDLVLSPANIAKELTRIAKHPYIAGQPFEYLPSATRREKDRSDGIGRQDDSTPMPSGGRQAVDEAGHGKHAGANSYKQIILLLRNHCGVDFSLYKPSTIQRRITRRIVLTRQETLAGYTGFLRGNVQELNSLFSDVLIGVTSFFRNPEVFEALQRVVLPKLLAERSDDPIRCWVLGCSTGQEAYSLAISLTEAAQKAPRVRKLQIFATDLNEKLLEKARHVIYAKALAKDM